MAVFTPIIPTAQQHPKLARMVEELHAPLREVNEEWVEGYAKPQADGTVREVVEDSVLKNPNAPVSPDVFVDDGYKEISAVLFSNCATVGKTRALSKGDQPCVFKALRYRAEYGAL